MQSESLVDISNMSKSDEHTQNSQTKEDSVMQKKRRRTGKGKGWSQKEEDRILKYALKLSQKEYEMKVESSQFENQIPKKLAEMEDVKVYRASEEEFLNPLKLFDSLWEKDENSSGMIKIIPPPNWVASQKQLIEKNYKPLLLDPQKKLLSRKQTLNELYLAKVLIKSHKNIFLNIFLFFIIFLISNPVLRIIRLKVMKWLILF
jgi:uncharacterized protein YozE (UPF0346 family)